VDCTTDIRDGMAIDWDVPIEMDDGNVLRADVFRPLAPGTYPVLMTHGPYGKGLSFQEGYKTPWDLMAARYPDALEGSTNQYQSWEVCDPEKWVPDGYVVVRVDSRGAGRSPGFIDHFSARENQDYYQCIEWAGVQPWSNGKVGLNGISYYGAGQWIVAGMQPPHLAAICPWEGFSDAYRESAFHGGIRCSFGKNWQELQVRSVQHGRAGGPVSKITGKAVCGDEVFSEETLKANRADVAGRSAAHPYDDALYVQGQAKLGQVTVPVLSAGNWGGQGLHLRGNVEGFLGAASEQKWLELHGNEHWTLFYAKYGVDLQKQFFGHFLKGEDNGWDQRPPILLNVRHVDKFVQRAENEWPLARTQWTKMHLDLEGKALSSTSSGKASTAAFDATRNGGICFTSAPFEQETEITGPLACKLFVSSSTTDADIFLVLHLFDPEGKEKVFQGALDPMTSVGKGWLRASRRELDPARSLPYRPLHAHQRDLPLVPGQPVELDVEIWPTSIVVPAGWRIGLTVQGKDYEQEGPVSQLSNVKNPMKGCGPFLHDDPEDRPPAIFGGQTTLHAGEGMQPHLLSPIVPLR
jgi:predicted acyl esterase